MLSKNDDKCAVFKMSGFKISNKFPVYKLPLENIYYEYLFSILWYIAGVLSPSVAAHNNQNR